MQHGRQTIARHGALRSPSAVGTLFRLLGVVVAVVVIAAGTVAGFTAWSTLHTVSSNAIELNPSAKPLPPTIGEIEGGFNLLLVGTDACEGQDVALFPRCGMDDDGGERNDVTMLVHVSDAPRRVTVVSFPRDMQVQIAACPTEDDPRTSPRPTDKLTSSYQYGGLPCTAATIESLTGMDIQFAAAIRWTGVIGLSDAIGGVDVCLEEAVSDRHSLLDLPAGNHTLQGVQALQFLRLRHGIGDGSDLGRIANQQQFMSSLVRKLKDAGTLGDPVRLLHVASAVIRQIDAGQLVLDQNLADPTRMVQLAMALKDVPFEEIVFVQYPTGTDGDLVLPVSDAADTLFDALRENKAIRLTGGQNDVFGQSVVGEVDDAGAVPPAAEPPSEEATPDDTAVDLPSAITGQTAKQVTCARAERG